MCWRGLNMSYKVLLRDICLFWFFSDMSILKWLFIYRGLWCYQFYKLKKYSENFQDVIWDMEKKKKEGIEMLSQKILQQGWCCRSWIIFQDFYETSLFWVYFLLFVTWNVCLKDEQVCLGFSSVYQYSRGQIIRMNSSFS